MFAWCLRRLDTLNQCFCSKWETEDLVNTGVDQAMEVLNVAVKLLKLFIFNLWFPLLVWSWIWCGVDLKQA